MRTKLRRTNRGLMFGKAGLGLHAMIIAAGRQLQTDVSYDWHGLRRGSAPFALIQVTLAGRGMLSHEGRQWEVGPGHAMLLHFPHDNRYWLPAGWRWEFYYLCLNGSAVMQAWQLAVARLGPLLRLAADSPLLQQSRQVCADVLDQRLITPWQASAAAYGLAMELLALAVGEPAADRAPRPAGIRQALDLCHHQPQRRFTVAELARVAGYSRCHFARVFARSEGLTPRQFLLNHRLSRAVRMIHTTSVPIKAIARDCGFYDPQHFCRVFRSVYGSTPGALRRTGVFGP